MIGITSIVICFGINVFTIRCKQFGMNKCGSIWILVEFRSKKVVS